MIWGVKKIKVTRANLFLLFPHRVRQAEPDGQGRRVVKFSVDPHMERQLKEPSDWRLPHSVEVAFNHREKNMWTALVDQLDIEIIEPEAKA